MNNEWYEQKPCVIVDGEYIPVDDVDFIDIEEDISGRDLMTFIYENQKRKSYVINH
jgi:predicted thioredoxin/glutaredoxin